MSDRPASPVTLLPYGEDPLAALADLILTDHRASLPVLDSVVVIVPHPGSAARLRRLLLERIPNTTDAALLPPFIGSLPQWLARRQPPAPVLSDTAREVMLYDAIAGHPDLCAPEDRWALAGSLLGLFDDLARNRHPLLQDARRFNTRLARAWGVPEPLPEPLQGEADLLYRLWQAWQQHVADSGRGDPGDQYARSLQQDAGEPETASLYIAGLWAASTTELNWLRSRLEQGNTTVLLQGTGIGEGYNPETPLNELLSALELRPPPPPATDLGRLLSQTFAPAGSPAMALRAREFADQCPDSPARAVIKVCAAADAEQEARAVELQVRRWWLAGRRNIGVVTNDRKLARRVRALLERAGLQLQDGAGWRLSTTSAATGLLRLLDCVEQNFHHAPLLDLLKSPFVAPPGIGADMLDRCRRLLERDLVLDGRVSAGLDRYRRRLLAAGPRLAERYGTTTPAQTGALLDLIEAAVSGLAACHDHHPHPLRKFLDALQRAIEQLGIEDRYAHDPAGLRLLQVLADMHKAAVRHGDRRLWSEFRGWLTRQLEVNNFQPGLAGEGVELMGFGESRLYAFDALVIAGANNDQLPGTSHVSPFFNDAVRAELGLGGARELRNMLLYDFRRLLQAAPRVLVTWRKEQNGEPLQPSPWLERLQAFHALAYGSELDDDTLAALLAVPGSRIRLDDGYPLPAPRPSPRPVAQSAAALRSVSASSYQRLMDCPYRYYAYDCLQLTDTPELKEDIEKSDYGIMVHRILHEFVRRSRGADGDTVPAPEQLDELLRQIAETEFAGQVSRSILARGWQYRWLRVLPDFLRWETERRVQWVPEATELALQRRLDGGDIAIELQGRIDRVDRHGGLRAIIDYKTGAVANTTEMVLAENIQLPFYALLLDAPVTEARFVQIDSDRVSDRAALESEQLEQLAQGAAERMLQIARALRAGAALPAWGDETTCSRCRLDGLCRRQYWVETQTPGAA